MKIKSKSKFMLGIFLSAVIFTVVPTTCFAHTYSPTSMLWGYVYGSTGSKYAQITIAPYNLGSSFTNAYNWSCVNWPQVASGDVKILQYSSGSSANIVVRSDTTPSGAPSNWSGANLPGTVDKTAIPYRIKSSTIMINSNLTSLSDANKEKIFSHEIGHCLGSQDTNIDPYYDTTTVSIMRQGTGSTLGWTNYQKPQTHDKTDVSGWYY